MDSVKKGNRKMKKRIAAYATAAVLIGIAIMALPLTLQQNLPLTFMDRTQGNAASSGKPSAFTNGGSSILDLVRQPLNFVPLGGIMLSGLIVALSVYLLVKKRTR